MLPEHAEILIRVDRRPLKPTRSARLRAPADFGLALQQARMAQGLSQTDLARELGITQSTVSAFETGKSTIHLRRLLELARATGITFTATWDDNDATRP